ncbi:MAG: C40 family peptidase, partial [Patescibacteria group bacterium]|nr:C40 family peptidase [Patescibacteria group bacterium]
EDVLVRSHFMRLYAQPSDDADAVRDAVIGCQLKAVDEQGSWYRIALPDGTSGWAKKKNFGSIPEPLPKNIVSLAREFLGYQYFWGGLTPKGFDCSGFVQTVYGLHGVQLPRDSWQQQQHHQVSTDYHDAQPGDLLFFSNKPDTVTHVAISLGQQKYIHASGWVRLDSFNENDDIFEKQRAQSFVSVNRYPLAG